ncbi:hypothetical protein [Amycolatopsis cihanbeyliensis]|uniref:hypothetical protein n=1 Tax=Amycolatopsis cihanbeyliensis TaxID=1128664 RepID=UPI001154351F|nr:hypothetical protein [Amycolatopsis cihanbeyliensis]
MVSAPRARGGPGRGSAYVLVIGTLLVVACYGMFETALAKGSDRTTALLSAVGYGLFMMVVLGTTAGIAGWMERVLIRLGRLRWLRALQILACAGTGLFAAFVLMAFGINRKLVEAGILPAEWAETGQQDAVYLVAPAAMSLLSAYFSVLCVFLPWAAAFAWLLSLAREPSPVEEPFPYRGTGSRRVLRWVFGNAFSLVLALVGLAHTVFGLYFALPVVIGLGLASIGVLWAVAERLTSW